jgi:L-fuculokinase
MQDVYLIYDIGKTNKKVLVFSEEGTVIDEFAEPFAETTDEDSFACDDLKLLTNWVLGQYEQLRKDARYRIKAVNFATYGASFVHLDQFGNPLTPLYNYLKPFPQSLKQTFLHTYFDGSEEAFATETASPLMDMLNSGLQLYWLKHTRPEIWSKIKYSLHLPQYLSYLFTGLGISDFTSAGCHTGLWHAAAGDYHSWVRAEELHQKLAPFTTSAIAGYDDGIAIGAGLHDSSAALLPYLQQCKEPFLLISTGTWCINLNPFNASPLTLDELRRDCLCYLQPDGKPVKASRIFLGKEHEYQTHRIAAHFNLQPDFYRDINVAADVFNTSPFVPACMQGTGPLPHAPAQEWDLNNFASAEAAYTALLHGLTALLKMSIDLVDTPDINTFFIDGGFAANRLFRDLLQQHYPNKRMETLAFAQATALGAFLRVKTAL